MAIRAAVLRAAYVINVITYNNSLYQMYSNCQARKPARPVTAERNTGFVPQKRRIARLGLDISLESSVGEAEARFVVLPISGRACVRALGLPAAYPKDPADRIIAATALVEGLPLLTADRAIRRARALTTIW
jgi:predicted nucleic acid-binding protein